MRLIENLKKLSDDPEKYSSEWRPIHFFQSSQPQKCLCSKKVKTCCVLENISNGNKTIVGDTCLKYALGDDYSFVFDLMKTKGSLKLLALSSHQLSELVKLKLITNDEEDFIASLRNLNPIPELESKNLQLIRNKISQAMPSYFIFNFEKPILLPLKFKSDEK
jgi:hypothetical protein